MEVRNYAPRSTAEYFINAKFSWHYHHWWVAWTSKIKYQRKHVEPLRAKSGDQSSLRMSTVRNKLQTLQYFLEYISKVLNLLRSVSLWLPQSEILHLCLPSWKNALNRECKKEHVLWRVSYSIFVHLVDSTHSKTSQLRRGTMSLLFPPHIAATGCISSHQTIRDSRRC